MRHVAWLLTILLLGCLPPQGEKRGSRQTARVHVPAQVGLTVDVPVRDLLRLPGWRDLKGAGADDLRVSVHFRGAPVRCLIGLGSDGSLTDDDQIRFVVTESNRHAPFLVYQIERLAPDPGLKGADLDEAVCDTSFEAELPGGPLGAVGHHVATVHTDPAPSADEPPVDASTWDRWRHADYLMLAPRAWLGSLRPLVRHRERRGHTVAVMAVEDVYDRLSGGNPDPRVLKQAVDSFSAHTRGRLHYLLLVGDVERRYHAAADGPATVPTFYERKVHYPGYTDEHEFPTDHPYGVAAERYSRPTAPRPAASIAVGRFPARTRAEVERLTRKVLAYETGQPQGRWRRRLLLFGGPANYGKLVDGFIESQATWLLNSVLPYDYDLRVVFAKASSPYAYRMDALGDKMASELNDGALFAAYFGHGLPDAFDYVRFRDRVYPIGDHEAMAKVDIGEGKPVFLSFTCHTGAFDLDGGEPSIGETMFLSARGPIAIFASSRASHPYPNALYAKSFIEQLLDRQPPTLGDGLLRMKKQMRESRILLAEPLVGQNTTELKAEHEGLYNLLGDPALRLRYPARVPVRARARHQADAAPGGLRPNGQILVDVETAARGGKAVLTLETERQVIRGKLVSPKRLARMSTRKALAAMASNHHKALDKVVEAREVTIKDGRATATFTLPSRSGRYIVKALVRGQDGKVSVGHTQLRVVARRAAKR